MKLMNCLQGEGDYAQVPNLSFKRNGQIIENDMGELDNIDSIEFPDREIYAKHKDDVDFSVVYVLTSRGCPYKCTFCFEEEQQKLFKGLGNYVRIRTPENIFAEINSDCNLYEMFSVQNIWLIMYANTKKI